MPEAEVDTSKVGTSEMERTRKKNLVFVLQKYLWGSTHRKRV